MRSWSYSHWSIAVQCLQKYKLCVIDNIVPKGSESADLIFGSALHLAMDALFTGVDDPSAVFESYWNAQLTQDVKYGRYNHSQLLEMGINFISKFNRLQLPKYERIVGEKRYYGTYRDIRLEGTVDWVGRYQGALTLADWKTTGYSYDKDKALIGTQLHLYAYLYTQSTGQRIEQLMYVPFVKYNGAIQTPVIVPYDHKKVLAHLDSMVDYILLIDKQDTWPKNSAACMIGQSKCQYFETCWKESK